MSDRNKRRRVIREARRWIGTPYMHQASVCGHGCDCLGLVRGVWRKTIGNEPQVVPVYSADWAEVSGEEIMLEAFNKCFIPLNPAKALTGDIALFRWQKSSVVKHAGILSRRHGFIHAYEGSGVVETTLGRHWKSRMVAAFRFPDTDKYGG